MKSLLFLLILLFNHALYIHNSTGIRKTNNFIQEDLSQYNDDYDRDVGDKPKPKVSNKSTLIIKDWFGAKIKDCNSKNCLPKYGKCETATKCKCNYGYANAPKTKHNFACAYKQKKQLIAFLLEMFIMGAGHIYRGAIITGVIKLLFIVLFPCMLLCLVFLGIIVESDIKSQTCFLITSIAISVAYILVVIVWYFYDIVHLAENTYPDGQGVPLLKW